MAARSGILTAPALSFRDASRKIFEARHLFLSNVAISFYTNALALVLGITSGVAQVGLYSGASKLRMAAQSALSPIGMVAYPKMNYLAANDGQRAEKAAFLLLKVQSAVALALSLGLCATAPLAVRIALGRGFESAVPVLQVQSWLIVVIAVSNVLGLMIMLPFGMTKQFSHSVVIGAIVGFALVFPMSYCAGALGASFAALVAEIVVTTLMYVAVARRFAWMPRFRVGAIRLD
jgi:O-antigen/teichoic acid export membrane protein